MSHTYLSCPGPSPPEQELLRLTSASPVDLLCAPVPSCLPSPQLRPDPVILQSADLIQFEEHLQEPSGRIYCVVGLKDKITCQYSKCLVEVGETIPFQAQNTCADYSGHSFPVRVPPEPEGGLGSKQGSDGAT